jgi:hypothetical protein
LLELGLGELLGLVLELLGLGELLLGLVLELLEHV